MKQGHGLVADENTVTRGLQEPNLIFPPWSNDSVFVNSAFVVAFIEY